MFTHTLVHAYIPHLWKISAELDRRGRIGLEDITYYLFPITKTKRHNTSKSDRNKEHYYEALCGCATFPQLSSDIAVTVPLAITTYRVPLLDTRHHYSLVKDAGYEWFFA